MFNEKELTRLGDILVSKGLLTPAQLDIAINEQSHRKRLLNPADPSVAVTPIGEILIELGFIDQLQLKRGLNWQQRLRHASIAMALCAPFMIFAPSAAANVVRTAPTTIEAEHYTTMQGVIAENTTDIGAGKNVGGISTGDWMAYSVDLPVAGTYKVTYRLASPYTTASLILRSANNTDLATLNVPKTGGWQVWTSVEQQVTLPKGVQTLKIFAKAGGFNLNWFQLEKIQDTNLNGIAPPVVIANAPAPVAAAATPTAPVVPGTPLTLQAESYTSMSGIISETTTDLGGGKSVGGISTNDWLLYDGINIPMTGEYKITYRVASPYTTAKLMLKSGSNVDLGLLAIPKTGGWQTWTDISHTLTLQQGVQSLKVFAQTGGFNFNWLKIESLIPLNQTIQAESYSSMFGVFSQTTTDVGGGQNVAGIATGEWMTYSGINVPADGNYKITYRVASTVSTGKIALHSAANVELGRVTVASTGGFQIWKDVEHTVALKKGVQDLKIVAASGGFNLNWFKMEFVGATNASSAASSSAPALASSRSSSSSAPAVSSSSSSRSSTPAMSSSSWSSSSVAAQVAGPVAITWMAPDKRENGAQLLIEELGGYEIRYKKTADVNFIYVSINDPWTQSYRFDWLEGDYIFQIAAFDKNGVYSPFVNIQRQ